MNLARRVLAAGVVVWLFAAASSTRSVQSAGLDQAAAAQPTPAPETVDLTAARAIVKRYCVSCHNERLKTGGLVLSTLDPAEVSRHPEIWEKVVQKLRTAMMPPSGLPRPDKATYEAVTGWFERELDRAAEANPNPGRLPAFHRLNRAEYHNAVRDLLGLQIDVASILPSDDSSYGFDNIGDILRVSPTLVESYLEAARRISNEAVGDPSIGRETFTYRVAADLTQDYWLEGLPFGTRGGMSLEHHFPVDGEYVIKAELLRSFIGTVMGLAEAHQVEFLLDGRRLEVFSVGGRRGKDDQQAEAQQAVQRSSERPADAHLELRVNVTAGVHTVAVTFPQRPAVQGEDLRPPYLRSYAVLSDFNSGQPHLASVAITGPFNGKVGETASRARIFACRPASPSDERACATRILSTLARRAYRRPVTEADVAPLLGFYEAGRKAAGFEAGIRRALQRLLVSPEFLVRIERDPPKIAPATNYRVSDLELAARLSFFFWSSIPDDELLEVAERGQLKDPAVLERQVRRMLADERAAALVNNFAGQWLYLRNVPSTRPDTQQFPDYDDNLRQAMRRETELLFDSIIREDRSALELLSARYTFVNERLARHYGMPNIYGSHFRRVSLSDDDPRGGLLGQASILTVTAYPNRTSPVIRGKWILENILNAAPPPPPPNVPDLRERSAEGKVLSMRERMVQHRTNPVCATCHTMMDPLGLALEPFDAIGRWRDKSESNEPIDASGTMPDGTSFNGPRELRQALLGNPDRFVATFTEKLLTYALGRGLTPYDAPAVRAITRMATQHEYRLSSVVMGIVTSPSFQMRRSPS